jgi:hypothetical protein
MEILGHSQIGVTLNTYSHVTPDLARAATASIEEALWKSLLVRWLCQSPVPARHRLTGTWAT